MWGDRVGNDKGWLEEILHSHSSHCDEWGTRALWLVEENRQ